MANIPAQNARKLFTTVLANIFDDFIEAPSFLTSFAKKRAYSTKTVQTLARRGTEKIAVDVIRGSRGNLNQMTKQSLMEYLPPYYKEKINVTAMNIYDIPFEAGAGQYNTSLIEALAMKTAREISEVKKMVDRAIELQMAQLLDSGVVELTNGDNIDYNRNASMIEVLTGEELWDATGVDIIKFFETKGSERLRKIGKVAAGGDVDCIMGLQAWQAFRSNKDIKDGENYYTKTVLDLNPARVETSGGGSYKGTLKVGNYNYDIWVYDEYYDNASDVATRYWDTTKVALIPRNFQAEISFAQVPMLPTWVRQNPRSNRVFTNLAQRMEGFSLFDYVLEEEETYYAGIKAAPLAQLISVDRVYTAKVLEDGAQVG